MARRRASSTLEMGSARDYPEHLNPFREDLDEDVQLRGADGDGRGTLGRLRRRASFASTWSMLTLRRSRPPSAPPSSDTTVATPRRRLRLSEIQSWLSLSTRRRSRSASAVPAPKSPPSPASPPARETLPPVEPFVLSPRTHRYRTSPPTPPEEVSRRAAVRLYGPQALGRFDCDEGEDTAALRAGPLPPLRIEEPPEQPLRAQEALLRAETTAPSPQRQGGGGRGAPEEGAVRPPRPHRPPRVRKRPAPPPPIVVPEAVTGPASPSPASTPTPPAGPTPPATPPGTPPATPPPQSDAAPSAGVAAASEDSAPEADQTSLPAIAPSPAPRFQGQGDAKQVKEVNMEEPAAEEEGADDGSPRAPPRKPRRASATADALSARVLPCA